VSFLAPAFLLFAAAAAIPLLVHLLRRRMEQRVEFPAARYLARAERENSRKLRLRNLLLMMLRVLAVLLVAAAAARPVGRLAGTGHAPTGVALVLDNSLSSSAIHDGRTMLEQLKDAARRVVATSSPTDQLWLVTADGQVTGGNASTIADAIEHVRPLAGRGSMADAVTRASGMLGGSSLAEQRLGILTDGQPSSWTDNIDIGRAETPVLVLAPRAATVANRAVVLAEARPTRWTPRGEVIARVAGADSASYRVLLGTRTLARGTVAPPEEVLVRAAPPERGWLAGSVELEPDELRGDDVRYFAVSVGPPAGVSVSPGTGPFVRSAVDALEESGRIATGSEVSVVAADELTSLPAVIIAPRDPVRLGTANRALERAGVPWRLGALVGTPGIVRSSGSAAWDSAQITVSSRHRLRPVRAEAHDTLAVVGAEPWIVAGDGYVLIASPLNPEATTLPVRAAFVPWLADALTQRLAGAGGGVLLATPGATLRRPPWAETIEDAEGRRAALTGATFRAPATSGVSFLLRGDARAGAIVVNGEPEESQLGRLDDRVLRRRIIADDVRVLEDGSAWAASIFGTADRRPLAVPFLVAAIAALLAESAVAGAGNRRAA
jgi:hypothetical protein